MSIHHRITELIEKNKNQVVIAAHHYQSAEVVKHAHVVGDSYRLAVECAKRQADFIVLCGVSFMAEGAAILAQPGQRVVIPEPDAGCPMADMVDEREALEVSQLLQEVTGETIAPVVYMNSTVGVKAVSGRLGGSVCTSSNAKKILDYYLKSGRKIFFAPDTHLGYNTVMMNQMLTEEQIAYVHPDMSITSSGDIRQAQLFLWQGFCPIHRAFNIEDIEEARGRYDQVNVILHPESDYEAVKAGDSFGSTDMILNAVTKSPAGSVWAVGTEWNFVTRLAQENPDKTIFPLSPSPCPNMAKTTAEKLLSTLENIDRVIHQGEALKNEVLVNPQQIQEASKALNQMIAITEGSV